MSRKAKMWLLVLLVFTFFIIVILGVSLFMKNIYTPEVILKTAVRENSLHNVDYILCKAAVTTGVDWLVIKNEDGINTRSYCNISGPNPYNEFIFSHEFFMAENIFVFYVVKKNTVYSELSKQDETEYVVSGWDILYPVKHEFPNIFAPNKYITEKDLLNDVR